MDTHIQGRALAQPETPHPFLDGKPKALLIDGQWRAPQSGASFAATNPATGDPLAEIAQGDAADIDLAVAAARRALEGGWGRMKPFDRAQILLRLADLVDEHFERLIHLDVLDVGTPITRLRGGRRVMVGRLRYYAAMATAIHGDTIENSIEPDFFTYTLREPVGVVGGITPWNGPLTSIIWRAGPILATGCTGVIKPAEDASLSALYMGQLMLEAGVPPGVINIVTGNGAATGAPLAAHPGIDKISFTGSTLTGQKIMQAAAGNMKRVTLELGGKSANIVFPDADLDRAVPACAWAVFGNSGQICAAGSRLFIHRDIHDEFVARLADYAASLRIGNGLDPDTQLGPLITPAQLAKVEGYCTAAAASGAEVATGGARLTGGARDKGNFFPPTVMAKLQDDMPIVQEEIFGPVICTLPFDSVEEVIARANASQFGLAGGLWTSNIDIVQKVTRGVRTGTIWVNGYSLFDPAVPFGGYKMSGIGRASGRQHIEEYLNVKSVWIGQAN